MFGKKQSSENSSMTEERSSKKSGCGCSTNAQTQTCSPEKTGAKGGKTRIIVKYDVGFNNTLYIRGKGANLSWTRGLPLKNIKADEWVWETDAPIQAGEFKILINDQMYENGPNHQLNGGNAVQIKPQFSK
jgi:hypothetical protein